eukprot:2318076-Alexandrium_andersonii.AAC.1
MSASLVGSEMCIRDRTVVEWWWNGGRMVVDLGWNGGGTVVKNGGTVGNGCLLYTSDAADDM